MRHRFKLKRTKEILRISAIVLVLYIFLMLFISAVIQDNPELMFPGQVSADITNPFGDDDSNITDQNYSERFKQFEGFVVVASATETKTHDLHLMALPGQRAKLYRNFTIYIFSNMPCFYEIRLDDQVYERGFSEWKAKVSGSSPYNTLDIEVRLINLTNVSLPVFLFSGLELLDNPWEATGGGGTPVVEEWIRMTRGDFSVWVIKMIFMQIGFGFLGAVGGTSLATIHADIRGIERLL